MTYDLFYQQLVDRIVGSEAPVSGKCRYVDLAFHIHPRSRQSEEIILLFRAVEIH